MASQYNGPLIVLDDAGNPVAGALIYTYEAGTNTPKAAYTTAALTVAATNPVVADAGGRAQFYLGGGSYRIEVTDPSGAVLTAYSADQQTAAATGTAGTTTVVEKYTATAAQTNFPTVATFTPGANKVAVFLNGLRLRLTDDFLEPNSGLITTTFPCVAGWELTIEINT